MRLQICETVRGSACVAHAPFKQAARKPQASTSSKLRQLPLSESRAMREKQGDEFSEVAPRLANLVLTESSERAHSTFECRRPTSASKSGGNLALPKSLGFRASLPLQTPRSEGSTCPTDPLAARERARAPCGAPPPRESENQKSVLHGDIGHLSSRAQRRSYTYTLKPEGLEELEGLSRLLTEPPGAGRLGARMVQLQQLGAQDLDFALWTHTLWTFPESTRVWRGLEHLEGRGRKHGPPQNDADPQISWLQIYVVWSGHLDFAQSSVQLLR